jgi:hypothetical protein
MTKTQLRMRNPGGIAADREDRLDVGIEKTLAKTLLPTMPVEPKRMTFIHPSAGALIAY